MGILFCILFSPCLPFSSSVPSLLCNTDMLNLIFPHPRQAVDNDPGQASTEIYELMHCKAQNTRGEDVVLHVRVPRQPEPLEIIERDIVLVDLVELCPEAFLREVRLGADERIEGKGRVPVWDILSAVAGLGEPGEDVWICAYISSENRTPVDDVLR